MCWKSWRGPPWEALASCWRRRRCCAVGDPKADEDVERQIDIIDVADHVYHGGHLETLAAWRLRSNLRVRYSLHVYLGLAEAVDLDAALAQQMSRDDGDGSRREVGELISTPAPCFLRARAIWRAASGSGRLWLAGGFLPGRLLVG